MELSAAFASVTVPMRAPLRFPPLAAPALRRSVAVPGPARPALRDAAGIGQSILDCMQIGALALADGWRVSFANRAAVRECTRAGLAHIDGSDLVVADPADRAALARAVDGALAGQWSLVRLGGGANALPVAVFPLPGGDGVPLALLLFGLNQRHEPLAVQLYAKSCGLTPAETRVLLGLSEGLVPKQIATRHDVLLSTVRSQIKGIRDKTGTRGLADLMQRLLSLPPLMPATFGAC